MKRILITGASGFVGRHCVELAVEQGYDVWAVRSSNSRSVDFPRSAEVHWRTVNLLDPTSLTGLMREVKPSHLLHAAWVTDHGSYWSSPANLDWLAMGAILFRLFAENGGRRFVSVGTCAEYDWAHGFMVEDVTPENPSTLYGKIKLAHHRALMAASEDLGFSAATGRIFFAYGPFENPSRFIPTLCSALANNKEAHMGTGQIYRDFMHVNDVSSGLMALLNTDQSGTFNISSSHPSRLIDIALELGRISRRSSLLRIGSRQSKSDESLMIVGSNRKLHQLGWHLRTDNSSGLIQTYDWWCNMVRK